MSADEYRPKEKIITPNGDDKNPYASFDGLVGEDYTISIFDIRGHKVKTITTSSLPRWDGTDDGGRVVESGVYLYQFKADVNGSSKLISGTIVVAK
jgi:gliding motility-associated-like protein